MPLAFTQRPKVRKSDLSTQRRYDAKDAPWSIIEVQGVVGRYWLVVRRGHAGEYVTGRYKTREIAERACRSQ